MKKSCFLIIILSVLFQFTFFSCDSESPVHTVNYVTRFGEVPKSIQVSSQNSLSESQLPELTQAGYIFDGWYLGDQKVTDATLITKDANLVAKWREIVYLTITYSSKYGTTPEPIQVIKGNILTEDDLPNLEAEGYEFKGWLTTNSRLVEPGEEITEDLNLVADWGKSIFRVSYSTSYGSTPPYFFAVKGNELSIAHLPKLQAEGYDFVGWYCNGELVEPGFVVQRDTILIASWVENPNAKPSGSSQPTGPGLSIPDEPEVVEPVITNFNIVYPQRASLNKSVSEGYKLTQADLPAPKSQPGYSFNGWYDENSKRYVRSGDAVNSDMKLVAKANKLSYNSQNWMCAIPDDYPVANILAPGSHDAGALDEVKVKTLYKIASPDLKYTAKCQDYGIADQLNMGSRFLDIRFNTKNDVVTIYHGCAKQPYTLAELLYAVQIFLKKNPTEAVFMHVKAEKVNDKLHSKKKFFANYPDQQQMSEDDLSRLISFASSNKIFGISPDMFATVSDVYKKNIGAVRGKLVLIKKYNAIGNDRNFGINLSEVDHISKPGEVKEDYTASAKMKEINDGMRAKTNRYLKYINGCAYKSKPLKIVFGLFGVESVKVPNTKDCDAVFHPGIKNTIKNSAKGSLSGFLVINFLDRDFCKLIYEHNFKPSFEPAW